MKKIYFISTLLLSYFGSVAQTIPTDSLVAKYMFDGNGDDVSGNNYDLTFVNAGLTEDRFGNTNQAMALDSAISYAYSTIGNHETAITIAFWYYSEGQTQPYPHFFDYGNYMFRCHLMSGSIYNSDQGGILIESNNSPTNNEMRGAIKPGEKKWTHVAVSFSNSGIEKLYINGELDKSKTIDNANLKLEDDTLNFGRIFRSGDLAGRNTSQFNGKMDDILVYNRELSSIEVKSIYNYLPLASVASKNNINSNIVIYPNPSKNTIHIRGIDAENSIIKLYNMEGKELLNISSSTLDISLFPSGIYMLKIFEKGSSLPSIHKVIKN